MNKFIDIRGENEIILIDTLIEQLNRFKEEGFKYIKLEPKLASNRFYADLETIIYKDV